MRTLWYLITFILGFIGILALVRTIERLAMGEGLLPVQLLIAIAMLAVAVLCLRKARAEQ